MSKKAFRISRKGPDHLMEELSGVLTADAWFEFKALFEIVHTNLRARKIGNGDSEMLRLRAYEKLQQLVQAGVVEKKLKEYRGVEARLSGFRAQFAVDHCRDLLQAVDAVGGPRSTHSIVQNN